MGAVLNLAGYQLVWFAAVLGAARGLAVWGLAAAGLFGVVQLALSSRRRARMRVESQR